MAPKILVMCRDRGLREVLADILRTEGFEPLSAEEIMDGEALARENELSAVLADLEGPVYHVSEWEPLARLHSAASEVPIILCTTHAQTVQSDYEHLGVAAVVTMPFEIEELLGTLDRVLDP